MERYHIFKLGLAILFYAAYCIRPMMVNGLLNEVDPNTDTSNHNDSARKAADYYMFYQGVEGTPGVDFPIYSHIPRTTFSCRGVESGYYADLDTDCQVFHICEEGRKISFLCPNGTIFQQSDLICEWWFKVNCTESPSLYADSAEQLRNDASKRKWNRRHQESRHGAVMRTEEAQSVSARKNGKNYEVRNEVHHRQEQRQQVQHQQVQQQQHQQRQKSEQTQENQGKVNQERARNSSKENNRVQSRPLDENHKQKPRRFDDAQTSNHLNSNGENGKISTTTPHPSSRTSVAGLKEYHVQFLPTSPGSDGSSSEKYYVSTTASSLNSFPNEDKKVAKVNLNRGDVKFSFGVEKDFKSNERIENSDSSFRTPEKDFRTYNNQQVVLTIRSDLEFPTHKSDLKQFEQTQVDSQKEIAREKPLIISNSNKFGFADKSKVDLKEATKQQSSVSLTKNDIINRRLEATDSDESQIPQESSSFVKSSFNSIKETNQKYSTLNPYPNHRTTYSDLKKPDNISPQKVISTISSVTPQYLTTQSINNGKPFLGSRVGATIQTSLERGKNLGKTEITTERVVSTTNYPTSSKANRDETISTILLGVLRNTTPQPFQIPQKEKGGDVTISKAIPLDKNTFLDSFKNDEQNSGDFNTLTSKFASLFNFSNSVSTEVPTTTVGKAQTSVVSTYFVPTSGLNVGNTDKTLPPLTETTTVTNAIPTEIFNVGSTDMTIDPGTLPTSTNPPLNISVPLQGSLNVGHGVQSNAKPSVTGRFNTGEGKVQINVQNLVSTPAPLESSTGRVLDHATVYGTFPRSSTISPTTRAGQVQFNKNSDKISLSLSKGFGGIPSSTLRPSAGGSISSSTTPFSVSLAQNSLIQSQESLSSFKLPISTTATPTKAVPSGFNVGPTVTDHDAKKWLADRYKVYDSSKLLKSSNPTATQVVFTTKRPRSSSVIHLKTGDAHFNSAVQPPLLSTKANVHFSDLEDSNSGFFVTKDSPKETLSVSSSTNALKPFETRLKPRPFEKSLEFSTKAPLTTTSPYLTYKISSASPFKPPSKEVKPQPTLPTPFALPTTTQQPTVYENVDNMINVLMEIAKKNKNKPEDYSSETPRPGLVVPPSAGPQTLHTLAVYFANALDGIVAEKEKLGEEVDDEGKEKLTSLLTQMTMHAYSSLFNENEDGKSASSSETETENRFGENKDEGLQLEGSNNLGETPQIRQLARNFSIALASYLDNPQSFRKDLEELRPTEPPSFDFSDDSTEASSINIENSTGDEELLNFSDADSKSSLPPIFPPTTSKPDVSPTWGYIIAGVTKSSEPNIDLVKNSLNPDLNTADSQSFIPSFNNLNADNDGDDKRSNKDLPTDHWTSSSGATKLWKSALSVNPIVVNEQIDVSTEEPLTTERTEEYSEPIGDSLPIFDQPQSEIHYELRTLPKVTLNSTQVHGILIDFMNTTKLDDSNRLQRLLRKLNTTEDEFLNRMKEIESNPLTKRLILLLISECGANATKDLTGPLNNLSQEILEPSGSSNSAVTGQTDLREKSHLENGKSNSFVPRLVNPALKEDDQDTRALQLLNSLYTIASRFGK